MQTWSVLACLLSLAAGQEFAMKFDATSKSRVWFGNVVETPSAGGPLPCRACDVKSDLCYPDYTNGWYPTAVNTTPLVLPQWALTLETWVRFDALNSTTHLISVTDGADEARNMPSAGFRLGFYRGFPTFGVAVSYTPSNWPSQDLLGVSGPGALQWVIGRWYHLAGTWDGTYRRLYVDGELMDAYKASYSIWNPEYSTAQFTLGASAHCDAEILFSGSITEARVWEIARTAAEIKGLMNVRATGSEAGLVGLWRAVETDGTVVDLSGRQPIGISRAVVAEPLPSFPPPQPQPRWTSGVSPCKATSDPFCASVVDYLYFAPNNTWQWRVEATLNSMSILISLTSPKCFKAATKHLCSLWYPRCLLRNVTQMHQPDPLVNYSIPLTFQTWVPMPVSRENCLALGVSCAVEFTSMDGVGLRGAYNLAAYQVGIPDRRSNFSQCTGSWLLQGNDTFSRGVAFPPANSSTHTYGSFIFSEPFVATNGSNSSGAVLAPPAPSCEYPFVVRPHISEEFQHAFIQGFLTMTNIAPSDFVDSPYCIRQCPPPLMPDLQYVTYAEVTGGMAVFSFIFSFLIALFLLRDPQKRAFPGAMMVLILLSVMGLSLALSLSLFGGWDQYFCLNEHNAEAAQGDSALCDTQAVLVQFFLATTQSYWCAMCLFLHSVLKMKPSTNWKLYTFVPLLPALISVIVLASLGKMGLASSGNICWVKSGEIALVWCLYYAPGLLNVLFSMYIIVFYARNRKGFKKDAAFLRMLQITALLLVAAIFSLAAQLHISAQYPLFIEASGQVLQCRNLADAFNLVTKLHPPNMNNTQEVLDSLRLAGGFDATGNRSSCKPFDSGFVVGVIYVDQIVFAMLGTLVPLILVARQSKKVFCFERWSVKRTTGSTKTLSNLGSSSRSGVMELTSGADGSLRTGSEASKDDS